MPSINLSEEEIHLLTGALEMTLCDEARKDDFKLCNSLQKRLEQLIDMPDESDDLIEALAAQAHEAWSGWMTYLFSKCDQAISEASLGGHRSVTYTIPPWAVERWTRQINTDYNDLPEDEKKSERVEARKYLTCVIRADALFDDTKEQESQL